MRISHVTALLAAGALLGWLGMPVAAAHSACVDLGGTVDCGEMSVREEARGLLLPTAIFARWSR